jgi:molybdopterin-containing oxidoreductase family iron-sulfur binding subunit
LKDEKLNDKSRRSFIKTLLLGTGATIIGTSMLNLGSNSNLNLASKKEDNSSHQSDEVPDDPSKHWGFLIDLSKCDKCDSQSELTDENIPDKIKSEKQRCSYACRVGHSFLKADPPQYWINVYKLQDNSHTPPYNFPKPCQNCANPPCEHVCPTGATYIRKDGTVLIDHKICIGCRICMAACPYETRFFWYNDPDQEENSADPGNYKPEYPIPHTKGTVTKCDYCIHEVYNNQLPHCVTACPQGALYFGNFNEDAVSNGKEILELSKTLEAKGAYRFKEVEGTNPSVFYLPPSFRNIDLW